MTPPEIDAAVHRQLGELVAGIHGLQDSIRRMEEASRRSDDKSEASRAVVHRRLDEVVDRVGKMEGVVDQVKDEVTEMKPVTDDVRKWKLMGIGALGVVGIGGTALGVSIAGFLDNISRFFHR